MPAEAEVPHADDGRADLARGLLQEAVDCIKHATDLLDAGDERSALSAHAEELARIAGSLGAGDR